VEGETGVGADRAMAPLSDGRGKKKKEGGGSKNALKGKIQRIAGRFLGIKESGSLFLGSAA